MKDYTTILKEGASEVIDRKSRFIGVAAPCQTEQEALDLIAREKKRYPDARHHVYAYLLRENNIRRYSDDGEPSGTAGMPVLDVIQKSGLSDICIVVTRYFGGTLLGTGGLVHAYGRSATEAATNAGICKMTLCTVFSASCDYTLSGKLLYYLENSDCIILSKDFLNNVTFTCAVQDFEKMKKDIIETTAGRSKISFIEEKYIAM